MRIYIFVFILTSIFYISCSNGLKEINIKDDEGTIVEKYYIDEDSLRQGPYVSYLNEGKVFEESNYKNNEFDGERTIYHKNGEIEIKEIYKDGVLEGPYKTFYDNGQLNLLANYHNGIMEGIVKRYYETGELMEEVTFSNNMENGPFTEYHKNGQVKWKGNYKNGDNEYGIIEEYNEEGELVKKMKCGTYKGEYICQTIWTLEEGDKALSLTYDEE